MAEMIAGALIMLFGIVFGFSMAVAIANTRNRMDE